MRWAICAFLLVASVPAQAVQNGSFTATWTPATDPAEVYEFRWRHFAAPDWIALPHMKGSLGTMTVAFSALPATPTTDRWMCLDARQIEPVVGPWLSTTTIGAACNTVEIGTMALPPPPPVVAPPPVVVPPATPPSVPPIVELFGNLTNKHGVLSFDYFTRDCPRGVRQTTSAEKNGLRTITLTCRR